MKLRVGSRGSHLAVIQSELVMDALKRARPEVELELVTMKTTGDRILDRPLDQVGGKGLFVKELDAALREGRVDLTVHSCKDLPADLPEELPIAAFLRREDPRDALVLPAGERGIPADRPIGSASPRRQRLLRELFPGREVKSVRGNVLTRLRKLDEGEYGALVLVFCVGQAMACTFSIFAVSAIQQRTPEHMTGKVMACVSTISMCAQPLGQMLYGLWFDASPGWVVLPASGAAIFALGVCSRKLFEKW